MTCGRASRNSSVLTVLLRTSCCESNDATGLGAARSSRAIREPVTTISSSSSCAKAGVTKATAAPVRTVERMSCAASVDFLIDIPPESYRAARKISPPSSTAHRRGHSSRNRPRTPRLSRIGPVGADPMGAKATPSTRITARFNGVFRPSPESNNFVKRPVTSVTVRLISRPDQALTGARSKGAVTRGAAASNGSTPCQM